MTDVRTDVPETAYKQDDDNRKHISEYGLRDELINGIIADGLDLAYSAGGFKLYKDGVWRDADDYRVKEILSLKLARLIRHYRISLSRATEVNMTELLKSLTYQDAGVWNSHPNIIVFKNTAFDVGKMQAVRHSSQYMSTVQIPYDYDREATAPTWERVLKDALSTDEQRFLQEYAGYCLTTSVHHQIALWLYGPPGSSKSTLIAGFEAMLGDLAGALSLTQLGSRFGLAGIEGKTLLTCTEVPKQHVKATDVLNAMITGDTLQVERKGKDVYDHRSTAKLMWAMNNLPGLYDAKNGLFRRVKVLELRAIPESKRNPEVIEQVRLEGSGIVNWALDGLARLNERGRFQYPKSILEATAKFKQENDLPAQFLEERSERPDGQLYDTKQYRVYASDLTEAFNEWAHKNGHTGTWSTNALAPEWRRLRLLEGGKHGLAERDRRGKLWYGVRLV